MCNQVVCEKTETKVSFGSFIHFKDVDDPLHVSLVTMTEAEVQYISYTGM
jgi:hypothetical protein